MKYRIAKKVIKRSNAGARYPRKTYLEAGKVWMRRTKRYYPTFYANWYFSQKATRDLNKMMKARGLDHTFKIDVVIAQEAA